VRAYKKAVVRSARRHAIDLLRNNSLGIEPDQKACNRRPLIDMEDEKWEDVMGGSRSAARPSPGFGL
jgi:hypothetical protein